MVTMRELKAEQLSTRCITEADGVTIIQIVPQEDDQVITLSWLFLPMVIEWLAAALNEHAAELRGDVKK